MPVRNLLRIIVENYPSVFVFSRIQQLAHFRFLCQASSLDFLSRQNFDFNKLIRDGVSYLKSDDEKRLREAIDEKRELRRQSNQVRL